MLIKLFKRGNELKYLKLIHNNQYCKLSVFRQIKCIYLLPKIEWHGEPIPLKSTLYSLNYIIKTTRRGRSPRRLRS